MIQSHMREKFFFKTDSKEIHGLIVIIYPVFRIRLLFIRFSRGRAISIAKQISRTPTNMVYYVVLSLSFSPGTNIFACNSF